MLPQSAAKIQSSCMEKIIRCQEIEQITSTNFNLQVIGFHMSFKIHHQGVPFCCHKCYKEILCVRGFAGSLTAEVTRSLPYFRFVQGLLQDLCFRGFKRRYLFDGITSFSKLLGLHRTMELLSLQVITKCCYRPSTFH